MFDPTVGRWLSEDPEGFAAAAPNLSRYVGNDATDATDPAGLEVRLPISRLAHIEWTQFRAQLLEEKNAFAEKLKIFPGDSDVRKWTRDHVSGILKNAINAPEALRIAALEALASSRAYVRLWVDGEDKCGDFTVDDKKVQAEVVNMNSGLLSLAKIELHSDLKLIENVSHNGYKNKDGKKRGWGSTKVSLTVTLTGSLPGFFGTVKAYTVNLSPIYTFAVPPGSGPAGNFPKVGGWVPILKDGPVVVVSLDTFEEKASDIATQEMPTKDAK